jgi:SNF2 family DNA or RNA helicase
MDTDGHCMLSKNGIFKSTEYSTISEKLCDDVAEIVHTLGGICRKRSRRSFYKKDGVRVECNISYRLNIKLPPGMNPFRLKRKSDRYNEPKKYPTGRYISKIEKHGEDECTCISVDSPDKLYVAEHCIVTHNTTSAIIASMESGAKKVLIICPASLKINWQREIENYSDKKVLIVEGKKWGSTFDYYIINYDIIKNYHSMESVALGEEIRQPILKEKFDLVIIDEAHMISNPTANRTKLINDIVEKIPKVWLLSGTPMTSRPINYYNILKIVNSPIALNWQSYVKRYCGGYQFTVNGKKIWNTGGATNLDELRERTKNLVLRRMKTDILDLPDKIITPIFLDLKSTFYDEELEDFMRITNENKNKESLSITINRLMKVRQVIAYEKVEYTSEIIDRCLEQGKKVIVFTNFTMTLDMLHEKYKKNSVVLDGRMSKEKRQQSVDRFQSEDKVKIFISNIIAGGVGITLTEAEVVIMNDLSFVPAHHSQAEDRAFRYGQKKNVMVYYPIFENTMEKIVYNILNKKKNIIDQVMGDGDFSESFATSLLKELV